MQSLQELLNATEKTCSLNDNLSGRTPQTQAVSGAPGLFIDRMSENLEIDQNRAVSVDCNAKFLGEEHGKFADPTSYQQFTQMFDIKLPQHAQQTFNYKNPASMSFPALNRDQLSDKMPEAKISNFQKMDEKKGVSVWNAAITHQEVAINSNFDLNNNWKSSSNDKIPVNLNQNKFKLSPRNEVTGKMFEKKYDDPKHGARAFHP
jgi:hypothetical protein